MTVYLTPDSQGEPELSHPSAEHGLREAISTLAKRDSYEARMQAVSAACSREFTENGNSDTTYSGPSQYAYVQSTYDDGVVFKKGNRTYYVTYTIEDGDIEFGEPEEVEDSYVGK